MMRDVRRRDKSQARYDESVSNFENEVAINGLRHFLLYTTMVMVVQGCATLPEEGTALVPPPGTTKDQISSDISHCYDEARNATTLLSEQERAPLRNRSTEAFFVSGMPVANAANEWPQLYSGSPSTTLGLRRYGPAKVTDHYVLCFLRRGYTWPIAPARK